MVKINPAGIVHQPEMAQPSSATLSRVQGGLRVGPRRLIWMSGWLFIVSMIPCAGKHEMPASLAQWRRQHFRVEPHERDRNGSSEAGGGSERKIAPRVGKGERDRFRWWNGGANATELKHKNGIAEEHGRRAGQVGRGVAYAGTESTPTADGWPRLLARWTMRDRVAISSSPTKGFARRRA